MTDARSSAGAVSDLSAACPAAGRQSTADAEAQSISGVILRLPASKRSRFERVRGSNSAIYIYTLR